MKRLLTLLMLMLAAPTYAQDSSTANVEAETILALKSLQLLDQRLHGVGYKLLSANAGFCPKTAYNSGMLLHDIAQYGNQDAARFALGFTGDISVNAVAEDSGADKAGIKAGDDLFQIEKQPSLEAETLVELAQEEEPAFRRIASVRMLLSDALADGEAELTILRGGVEEFITVKAERTCISDFQIAPSEKLEASANGRMVNISSALAEYLIGDDELAAIAAHELAHNLLEHRERLNAQNVNRGFFGQLGKSAGRIKATEIEADRLSVWLMANAGYDPSAAIRFWTRFGKQHGKGIFSASTHYRWKKRVGLFEEEIAKMEAMEPVDSKYAPPLLRPN